MATTKANQIRSIREVHFQIYIFILLATYPSQCSFWAPSQVSSDPPAQWAPIVGPSRFLDVQSPGAHPLAAAVAARVAIVSQDEQSSG